MIKWLWKFDKKAGNYGKFNFEKVLYSLSVFSGLILFFGLLIYIDYVSKL